MKRALLPVLMVLAALVLGYWTGHRDTPAAKSSATASGTTGSTGGKVLYWYDTMVPLQHFDHPGLSPMGMQMVPKYADDTGAHKGLVKIDPATVQNLGVRTASVQRRVLAGAITVPGTITWNLREATTVSARVDAVVTKLDTRAPYTRVVANAPLAELLAPQWNSALAEYAALQHAQSADAKALLAAARARLHVLGLTDADIRATHRGADAAITLHAPQAGVITTLDVREGQRVNAGQTLMTINGLSTVWVEAALPQAVTTTVRAGTPVTVTVNALPGRDFHGTVETLLPDIDNTTRTQRARIVLNNPDGVLSPGMFATVQLEPARGQARPVVPNSALIATGSQTRVILAKGDGKFQPVAVRTGQSSDGFTEILSGLHGGEKVVVSGQFLIDSEASLSGALERLGGADKGTANAASSPAPATAASAPIPGMSMGDKP